MTLTKDQLDKKETINKAFILWDATESMRKNKNATMNPDHLMINFVGLKKLDYIFCSCGRNVAPTGDWENHFSLSAETLNELKNTEAAPEKTVSNLSQYENRTEKVADELGVVRTVHTYHMFADDGTKINIVERSF